MKLIGMEVSMECLEEIISSYTNKSKSYNDRCLEEINQWKDDYKQLWLEHSELRIKYKALKLLVKTEAPHGLCENFLGCHSTRLDKYCLDCPDFVLDETIIDEYIERLSN